MAGTVFWYPLHRRFTWMSQNNVASQHQTKLTGKIPNFIGFFCSKGQGSKIYNWFILWWFYISFFTNQVSFNQFNLTLTTFDIHGVRNLLLFPGLLIPMFVKKKLNQNWPTGWCIFKWAHFKRPEIEMRNRGRLLRLQSI